MVCLMTLARSKLMAARTASLTTPDADIASLAQSCPAVDNATPRDLPGCCESRRRTERRNLSARHVRQFLRFAAAAQPLESPELELGYCTVPRCRGHGVNQLSASVRSKPRRYDNLRPVSDLSTSIFATLRNAR